MKKFTLLCFVFSLFLFGCNSNPPTMNEQKTIPDTAAKATFAGGCFWCMEGPFEELDAVYEVLSGYSGGDKQSPTYEEVTSGTTGHREVIQVLYDADKVSYDKLLEIYWRQIDPTDPGGQFADRGFQYTTAILYHDDKQKKLAEASKQALEDSEKFDKPIATAIEPFKAFYPAEDYHQDYYKKNAFNYKLYQKGSGRADYIEDTWREENKSESKGTQAPFETRYDDENYTKPSDPELKENLSALQYKVTQKDSTERAFSNEYWDNKEEGIYVDIVSGEPLFSSTHKYESGTGWPSFWQPLESDNIVEKDDYKLFVKRTEVRSKYGDSHLGHVFEDGPDPTGLRYCMNSASMRFVPKERLEEEGYGQYKALFDEA